MEVSSCYIKRLPFFIKDRLLLGFSYSFLFKNWTSFHFYFWLNYGNFRFHTLCFYYFHFDHMAFFLIGIISHDQSINIHDSFHQGCVESCHHLNPFKLFSIQNWFVRYGYYLSHLHN